ncbi:MAG: sugar transferase [Candidatus Taylorbacteria bacterium]|nr:sugar transferase [Candidatus Taylorbacteria bacterium]
MRIGNKKESLILLLGDIVAFFVALWLSLFIRNFEIPSFNALYSLAIPFSIISIVWIAFFFIAGLYEKQRIAKRKRLPELLLKTQLFNSVVAIFFFYSLPYFGVAPKTILFFYILISLGLSFIWRVYAVSLFSVKTKSHALMIAGGSNALSLRDEVNQNTQYGFSVVRIIDTESIKDLGIEEIERLIKVEKIKTIIVDSRSELVSPILPHLYKLIFSKISFIDFYDLYEDMFDRLPVSLIDYGWFLENISTGRRDTYEFLKRVMDLVLALPAFVITLPFYLFVYIGIKIQDNGPLFIVQERVGKNNRPIRILKFRSMNRNETDLSKATDNKVTKFGSFLRVSRIDELPQLVNVIKGDLTIVGPRPELPSGVKLYEKQIPYYNVRHIIKPGLFGWAQLYHENHPHHGVDVEETQNKLSYDLYYIKHRSFPLDIIIALKTIKILMSRQGR